MRGGIYDYGRGSEKTVYESQEILEAIAVVRTLESGWQTPWKGSPMPLDSFAQTEKRGETLAVAEGQRFDLATSLRSIGVRFRRERAGPEAELVRAFLKAFPIESKKGYRLTLFQEPQLLSGFPDLVAVQWHEQTAMQWTDLRICISADDLRIIHVLVTLGPRTEAELDSILRFRVQKILQRLKSAGLAASQNGIWRATSLRRAFAARRIIAFEAKISDWRGAIEQAALNRWFASESYVLLPSLPQAVSLVEMATRASVGIWILGDAKPVLKSPSDQTRQPISYASWLFNEWAWRFAVKRITQGVSR